MKILVAFFRRDYLYFSSYRMNYVAQVFGVAALLVTIYFMGEALAKLQGGGAGGHAYIAFILAGIAFTEPLMTGLGLHGSFREAQQNGTLEPLLVAPLRTAHLVLASSLFRFAYSFVKAAAMTTVAVALFGFWRNTNVVSALMVLIPGCLAFAGVGLIATALVLLIKRGDPLVNAFASANLILGGVFFPTALFPNWMQPLIFLTPLSHGLNGIRLALAGASPLLVLPESLVLTATAAILLPLSALALQLALTRAKKEGSLVQY